MPWYQAIFDPDSILTDVILGFAVWVALRIIKWVNGQPLTLKKEVVFWLTVVFLSVIAMQALRSLRVTGQAAPNLKVRSQSVFFSPMLDTNGPRKDWALVTCFLDVVNTGTPTAIRDWKAEVILSNEEHPFPGHLETPPEKWTAPWADGEVTFLRKDSIILKTLEPIQHGALVYGYIMFSVERLGRDHLSASGTVIRVSLIDVADRSYVCDYKISQGDKQAITLPPP
jgi:hypothetical protein